MKIVIIGAGNVGTNLHYALGKKHIDSLLHSSWDLSDLPSADVYIYAVADKALKDVIDQVNAPHALHLHTSGTVPIEVFGKDKPHAGVLYFFQSFSKASMIDDWSGIPCFIEGRNIDDIAAIYSLAQMLTSRIYEANQHDRERLHIAGVFANNYSNLMYRIAADVLKDTQIPFEALLPLIDYTAKKIHTVPPSEAQTGPAQRGDEEVMKHHMDILQTTPYGEVYQALAGLIGKARNH
jgi:predicted short-subunit dehydrogenase-like oxidoreductase (DUF2520 family)